MNKTKFVEYHLGLLSEREGRELEASPGFAEQSSDLSSRLLLRHPQQWKGLRDRLPQIIRLARKRVGGPKLIVISLLTVGLTAGVAYAWHDRSNSRAFNRFWATFANQETGLNVAIPDTVVLDPQSQEELVSRRMGVGDAIALGSLYNTMVDCGLPPSSIHLLTGKQVAGGVPATRPLVIIGGPVTSPTATAIAQLLAEKSQEIETSIFHRLKFQSPGAPESPFTRRGPSGVVDSATGELCAVDLEDTDAVLIILGDILDEHGKKLTVLMIAGLEELGTGLGMAAISRSSDLVSELERTHGRTGFAEVVLRVSRTQSSFEVFRFGSAKTQRGE